MTIQVYSQNSILNIIVNSSFEENIESEEFTLHKSDQILQVAIEKSFNICFYIFPQEMCLITYAPDGIRTMQKLDLKDKPTWCNLCVQKYNLSLKIKKRYTVCHHCLLYFL